MCPVVVKADKSERVREPAPVHTLVNLIEGSNLFVGNLSQFQVVKDVSARSNRNSQILMLVSSLIRFFQVFSLKQKLLSQPLRRRFQVCTLVAQPVRPLLQAVLVGPVVPADWRVVTLKVPELGAAAHGRL